MDNVIEHTWQKMMEFMRTLPLESLPLDWDAICQEARKATAEGEEEHG